MNRSAGILCPVFSIPANQGIGDLGQKTIRMIDIIADAGYTIWQILPLQMTGPTHSPYQTYSSFAGDPIYINLDRLCEMGLLTQSSKKLPLPQLVTVLLVMFVFISTNTPKRRAALALCLL